MTDLWPLFALLLMLGAGATLLTLLDWRVGALVLAAALPFEGLLPEVGASGMKVLTGVALLGLAIHLMRDGVLLARLLRNLGSGLSLLLLALVALCALSMLWAASPEAALGRTVTFLGVFLLMHLVALLDPPHLRRLWATLLLSAALTVPLGLAFTGDNAFADDGRFASGGLNPNDYGGLLVVILLVCGIGHPQLAGRTIRLLLAVTVLAGVLWSGSRTAFVALAAAPFIHLLLVPRESRGRALSHAALAYTAAGAVVLGVYAFDPPRAEAVEARALTLADYRDESTWAGRLDIWRGGREMVASAPVLGIGAGNFAVAAPLYSSMPRRPSDRGPGPVAHNIFLGVAGELGAVGLALFAALLVCAFTRARALAREAPLASGLLLGLVAYVLLGLSLSWEYQKIAYVVMGSLLALSAAPREAPA